MTYEETRVTLGARPNVQAIRNAMKFRGDMKNAELARRSGLSPSTVGNILKGTRKTFSTETANAVSGALGLSSEDLFVLEARRAPVARRTAA